MTLHSFTTTDTAPLRRVEDHSGGSTPTTNSAAAMRDVDADTRWREWQARGAASDRRTAMRMRTLMLLVAAALIVSFVVQLM